MTDREKKQREILEVLVLRETNRRYDKNEEVLGLSEQQSYAQAISKLAELDDRKEAENKNRKKELSNDKLAMYIGYIDGSNTLAEKMKMLNKIINALTDFQKEG